MKTWEGSLHKERTMKSNLVVGTDPGRDNVK